MPTPARQFTTKGQATQERIVKAAAEVILGDGLSGFTMDRVRKTASVSGSQLTHYFSDKQALIQAVLERQIGGVLDFHHQPKLGGLDTFDDYEQWINANVRYLRRVGYAGTPTYHALAGQLVKSDPATRDTVGNGYHRWIALLETAIQRMKDLGELIPVADPSRLARVLVAAHQGGATMTFAYRQEWPLTDALRFGVNYLRLFAVDPTNRTARRRRRARDSRKARVHDGSGSSARRFTQKGLATKMRIVDSAATLMFDRGVVGTSLEDVRTSVGVSGSQLSHYFTDKRELIRQVIAARATNVVSFHTRAALDNLDSLTALRAWADACVADIAPVYLRGGCIYGSLTGELLEADSDVLDELAAGYELWLRLFRDGLTAMRRRGELTTEADPRHLATTLVAAHQGGTMLTYAMQSAAPLQAAITAAVDYVGSFQSIARHNASR